MLIAGLLLGGFLGMVTAALVFAMRRGLWLKVEVGERVEHHHYLYADPMYGAPTAHLIEARVLPSAVLPRHTAARYQLTSRREIES